MIKTLLELEEAISKLKIEEPCKLRISRDGEEIFEIVGLSCISDDNDQLICDIHLEKRNSNKILN